MRMRLGITHTCFGDLALERKQFFLFLFLGRTMGFHIGAVKHRQLQFVDISLRKCFVDGESIIRVARGPKICE